MVAQREADRIASSLYEQFFALIISGTATSQEGVFAFLAEQGVNAPADQKVVLDIAHDYAGKRVEETNRADELVFDAYRVIARARMQLRRQAELKQFSDKYVGYTHEEALALDLAERRASWQQALVEEQRLFDMPLSDLQEHFRCVGDGLGLGIDDGIVDTVIALTAHGIPTVASCEGHVDHGLAYPWVDVSHRSPKSALTGEHDPLEAELSMLNEPVYPRLEALLAEFYSQHSSDVRLGLKGSRLMTVAPGDTAGQKLLEPSRAEMRAFTAFLLQRS